MKILMNTGKIENEIDYQSNFEKDVFENPLSKIKLAYEKKTFNEKNYFEIVSGTNFRYNKKNKIITLPNFLENLEESLYYTRIIFDSNSINKGYLPLHGASTIKNGEALFIFGDAKKGKSFTLESLANFSNPVGDDHLIVGKGEVVGNDYIRVRSKNGDKIKKLKNKQKDFDRYKIIYVDMGGRNKVEELLPKDIIKNDFLIKSVLKYGLISPFNEDAKKFFQENLINEETKKYYLELFYNFLKNSEKIKFIGGKRDLKKEIDEWK